MRHVTFGKIGDLRKMVKDISHCCRYSGKDENGDVVYNSDPLPKLTVKSTTKLHGSNASVSLQNGEYLCQSRNHIVSEGHFSFPEIVLQEKEHIESLFTQIREITEVGDDEVVTIFGEIIGPGIQRGVALSDLSKKYWVLFACKINNVEGEGRWVQGFDKIKSDSDRIFNIHEFPTQEFQIDIAFAQKSQNDLIEACLKVEECCPVAKKLEGIEGIGEGIVIETFYKGNRFTAKIKGDKHSKGSKVRKLTQVDPVKVASVEKFVAHAATESRVDQAIHEVGNSLGEELSKKHTGDIIRWVANDIIVEECDVLKENNLEYAQVAGKVANEVRNVYFAKLDTVGF